MPVQPTYPGVYIEEVPSGTRSITGVSTSVTAFIGRARRGVLDEPTHCYSFGDFIRRFGGMWEDSPMSYAVRDFFENQGSDALIVRVFEEDTATANLSGAASATVSDIRFTAISPGEWANQLEVSISHPDPISAKAYSADKPNIDEGDLFDLKIVDKGTGTEEIWRNLVTKTNGGARRVDRVLEAGSNLLRADGGSLTGNQPAPIDDSPIISGNDGSAELAVNTITGDSAKKKGMHSLEKADIFNILCIPPRKRDGDTDTRVWQRAANFCKEKRAFLIVDSPSSWEEIPSNAAAKAKTEQTINPIIALDEAARNAALYFPRIRKRDSEREGQLNTFVPCGAIAGIMARTDVNRGVWKAPAGIEAAIIGADELTINLTDVENGPLNQIGVNCLRSFRGVGRVAWGARTLRGADQLADDYKYIPVRRLALYIEESLFRGTQWVVFEPNDEPLWAQIRLNLGSFMHNLFRQGAFQGTTPKQAYLVKCDFETTTQNDIDQGIVNIVVGFAPKKPAEFVIIKIQQLTGQLDT